MYLDKTSNLIKYNKDNIYIVCNKLYKTYTISTDRYHIKWDVSKDKIEVFDNYNSGNGMFMDYLFSIDKKFDLGYFVDLENPNDTPINLLIKSASTNHIEHQIERLMKLKAFV